MLVGFFVYGNVYGIAAVNTKSVGDRSRRRRNRSALVDP